MTNQSKKKSSSQAAESTAQPVERLSFLMPLSLQKFPYRQKYMTRAIYGGLAKHEASGKLPDDLVVYRGTYKGERAILFATVVPQEKEKLVLYLECVLPSVRVVFLDPALIEDATKLKVNYDSESNKLKEQKCTHDNTGSVYTLASPEIGKCTGCKAKGLFVRTTCSDHHLCSLCDPGPAHASMCLQCDSAGLAGPYDRLSRTKLKPKPLSRVTMPGSQSPEEARPVAPQSGDSDDSGSEQDDLKDGDYSPQGSAAAKKKGSSQPKRSKAQSEAAAPRREKRKRNEGEQSSSLKRKRTSPPASSAFKTVELGAWTKYVDSFGGPNDAHTFVTDPSKIKKHLEDTDVRQKLGERVRNKATTPLDAIDGNNNALLLSVLLYSGTVVDVGREHNMSESEVKKRRRFLSWVIDKPALLAVYHETYQFGWRRDNGKLEVAARAAEHAADDVKKATRRVVDNIKAVFPEAFQKASKKPGATSPREDQGSDPAKTGEEEEATDASEEEQEEEEEEEASDKANSVQGREEEAADASEEEQEEEEEELMPSDEDETDPKGDE